MTPCFLDKESLARYTLVDASAIEVQINMEGLELARARYVTPGGVRDWLFAGHALSWETNHEFQR